MLNVKNLVRASALLAVFLVSHSAYSGSNTAPAVDIIPAADRLPPIDVAVGRVAGVVAIEMAALGLDLLHHRRLLAHDQAKSEAAGGANRASPAANSSGR